MPSGPPARTLRDAANYIKNLPRSEHDTPEWRLAIQPLARISGVLGRWGAVTERRLITDLLTQFGVRDSAGGLVMLISLRTYPAVLILYAYGLGLLAARRHADLFDLFTFPLVTNRDSAC